MKILLVEDNVDLLKTMQNVLTHLGYEVTTAMDASSASSVIESGSHFDILITDLMMPFKCGETPKANGDLVGECAFKAGISRRFLYSSEPELSKGVHFEKKFDKCDISKCIRFFSDIKKAS